ADPGHADGHGPARARPGVVANVRGEGDAALRVTSDGEAALLVSGLVKRYGDFRAVAGVSFRLAPGEVVGLCGPNGAGKTTTLRAISGIVAPSEGRILVAGHDVVQAPLEAKRRLAFV